jgi:hypothetical protein
MEPTTKPEPLSAALSGVAGEYFVAAELSRRGYIAALTLKNTRGVDILVSRTGSKQRATIQVKAIKGSGKEWVLTKKDEACGEPNHFYVFVALNGTKEPEYYVVPSETVAKQCRENHASWLSGKKRDGMPRKDSDMRIFSPGADFCGKWSSLGLDL